MEKIARPWGYYRVIHEIGDHTKVKELTVDAGGMLSMQKHSERAEHWFVSEGEATVYTIKDDEVILLGKYKQHDSLHIDQYQWHRLCNETVSPLKIIEIQYGKSCREEDIERR